LPCHFFRRYAADFFIFFFESFHYFHFFAGDAAFDFSFAAFRFIISFSLRRRFRFVIAAACRHAA